MNIWEELKKRNISESKIYFEGGEDDGGVDQIEFFYEDGRSELVNHNPDWENPNGAKTLEYELVSAVYNEYTFLGQPMISGVLTYTTETKDKSWDVEEEYEDEDED